MRAEREKLNAKITAGALKLSGGRLELPAEMCHIVLFSGGSCTVQCGDTSLLVSPGCALLLGPGAWAVSQAGHTQPEMLGCEFPLAVLHEMKNATGEDFLRLFAPGSQMALYGSIQWASRLRTLLEMMRGAMGEPEYPGGLYLALTLHYVEQEHRAQSAADARPRNETVEQICAYLAANYQQKLSLTEVAARCRLACCLRLACCTDFIFFIIFVIRRFLFYPHFNLRLADYFTFISHITLKSYRICSVIKSTAVYIWIYSLSIKFFKF